MLQTLKDLYNWYKGLHGNVTNLIFFVLGIVASIIYGWSTTDFREISIWPTESEIVVFDSTKSSPRLTLLDDQGKPITGTVFIDTVQIWNSGTETINSTDIRRPIQISISPVSRLIEPIVVRSTDGVANFRLVPITSTHKNTATVQFDWDFFDPGFGATIQLMYESNNRAKINVTGHILGIAPNYFAEKPIADPETRRFPMLTAVVFGILFSLFLLRKELLRRYRNSFFDELSPQYINQMEIVFDDDTWSRFRDKYAREGALRNYDLLNLRLLYMDHGDHGSIDLLEKFFKTLTNEQPWKIKLLVRSGLVLTPLVFIAGYMLFTNLLSFVVLVYFPRLIS